MLRRARLGMTMFLLSEAVFFFMLIVAFVYFRHPAPLPDLAFGAGAAFTACLTASCFTMWRAAVSATRDNANAVRGWLAATILLGAFFIVAQGDEYLRLFSYGSSERALFLLAGCHEVHVAAGILLLGGVFLFQAGEVRSVAVQTVALYWYFVTAVWIAIFSIVYLWAFL